MKYGRFPRILILTIQLLHWVPMAAGAQSFSQQSETNSESAAQQNAMPRLLVTFVQDGLLTVDARREPLSRLLEEVARRAKLPIIVDDDIAGTAVNPDAERPTGRGVWRASCRRTTLSISTAAVPRGALVAAPVLTVEHK